MSRKVKLNHHSRDYDLYLSDTWESQSAIKSFVILFGKLNEIDPLLELKFRLEVVSGYKSVFL